MDSDQRKIRKQEIVSMYDRAAQTYEQVGVRAATHFGRLLVERLKIPLGAQVLDVATGRGALLFPAAQCVGLEGHVTGIDLAPRMVESTTAEALTRKLTQVQVLLMDGDHPDFQEESFDFILCGFALSFLDYPQALKHFRELLKPTGTLGIVGSYVPTNDRKNLERWQWLFNLTKEVFPPGFKPPDAWTSPNRLYAHEPMQAALNDAGFESICTWSEEKVLYFRDEEDWWAWEWSQGSRFWLEGMPPEGLAKFKAVSFEKLNEMKEVKGIPMKWGALFATAKSPGAFAGF